jgi:hypothetical protein
VGIESAKRWVVFRKAGDQWRHQGPLGGLKGGLREKLLRAFAEHGGLLEKGVALKAACGTKFSRSEHEKLMGKIKPELSELRRILVEAVGVTRREGNPLPFERSSQAWRAEIAIGYAIQEDGQVLGGERRLRFRTREQLSPSERLDADS